MARGTTVHGTSTGTTANGGQPNPYYPEPESNVAAAEARPSAAGASPQKERRRLHGEGGKNGARF